MWPWGHAAVGYLLYLLITRRHPRIPLSVFIVLGIATQFPDLIDKPLSWSLAILPTGRSLTHSLLTAGIILGVAYTGLPKRYHAMRDAFAIGYLAHILGDAAHPLLTGEWEELTWLLWPLLPSPSFETPQSFLAHFREFSFEPITLIGFGFVIIAASIWSYRLYTTRRRPWTQLNQTERK